MRPTNDNLRLAPRTSFEGLVLEFELGGLEIGVAEYDEGPTGCTVFSFLPGGAACATDIRGGSPGTLGGYEWVHAICLAGGSLYGLEAATGVAAEIFARRDYATGWLEIPLVSGAIVFDWGPRDNAVYPDKQLGRAALRAARPGVFPLGPRGAGRSATAGKTFDYAEGEQAGQGGAFRQVGETRIGVFTVVNAVGAIVDRDGTVLRGHLDAVTGARRSLVPGVEERLRAGATGATAARQHDPHGARRQPATGRPVAADARAPGPHLDGSGDPALPRPRRRRRPLRRDDERGGAGAARRKLPPGWRLLRVARLLLERNCGSWCWGSCRY